MAASHPVQAVAVMVAVNGTVFAPRTKGTKAMKLKRLIMRRHLPCRCWGPRRLPRSPITVADLAMRAAQGVSTAGMAVAVTAAP